MPIFDYICRKCNYKEERIVKDYLMVESCPKCHIPMMRQFGAPHFRVYGEGFHKPNKR